MYIVRQNTSLSFWWRIEKKGRQDDWITINDNGVESVTHMYTEALLVLVHNVASFPLESLRTIDVFIFVLDDQWCMIFSRRKSKRNMEKISYCIFFICYFFQDVERERIRFFFFLLSNNHRRSFLFPLFGNVPLN